MITTCPKHLLATFLASICFIFAHNSFSQTALNGVAIYTELGQEQYIAGLYTSKLSSAQREVLVADNEKELQVRILANSISSRSFKKMWIEGLAINASSRELEAQSQNMADFSNMLKIRLLRGDIFTVRRDKTKVTVILNGSTLGEINDPKFFDILLRTWIGPVPLSTEFRQLLLSAGEMDANLVARFQTTLPSAARIAAISAGLEALAGGAKPVAVAKAAPAVAPAPAAPKVVEKPKEPVEIAKPKPLATKAPQVAKATPPPAKVTPPKVAIVEPPKVAKAEPPKVAKAEPPKVAKAEPPKVAKAEQPKPDLFFSGSSDSPLLDSSIFDIEEDEVEYTAESLLAQQLFIAKLKKWSQRFIEYPVSAQRRNQQGNVRLSVTIDDDGKVKDIEVLETAKYQVLTDEALAAVTRAAPFPRMPSEIPGEEFTFSIPIAFVLVDE